MLRVSKYRDFARVMMRARGGSLLEIVLSLLIPDSRNLSSEDNIRLAAPPLLRLTGLRREAHSRGSQQGRLGCLV